MKAFISCIAIATVISAHAEEEEWYDADGNLARVLPASEPTEEWQPHWQRPAEIQEVERFRWGHRRPYVRYARPYHRPYSYGYYGGYNWPSHYYRPYRLGGCYGGTYGLRGYYSSSSNWGVRIGRY